MYIFLACFVYLRFRVLHLVTHRGWGIASGAVWPELGQHACMFFFDKLMV